MVELISEICVTALHSTQANDILIDLRHYCLLHLLGVEIWTLGGEASVHLPFSLNMGLDENKTGWKGIWSH